MKNIIIIFTAICLGGFIQSTLNASIDRSTSISIFPNELCKEKGLNINKDNHCISTQNIIFSLDKDRLNDLLMKTQRTVDSITDNNKVNLPEEMAHKQKLQRLMIGPYHSILTLGIVEAMPDEKCTVSGLVLDPAKDLVVEIKGRRLPFKKEAVPMFLENPGKYFATKQSRGAFISEDMTNNAPINPIYFIIGLYILVGLIIGGLTGSLALKKGLKPSYWFILGFFLNVIGLILLLMQKKKEEAVPITMFGRINKTREPIVCLNCGYQNHPDANNCSKCNAVFVR